MCNVFVVWTTEKVHRSDGCQSGNVDFNSFQHTPCWHHQTTNSPKRKKELSGRHVDNDDDVIAAVGGDYVMKNKHSRCSDLINFLDVCKYILILNLTAATCFEPVGTRTTKDFLPLLPLPAVRVIPNSKKSCTSGLKFLSLDE